MSESLQSDETVHHPGTPTGTSRAETVSTVEAIIAAQLHIADVVQQDGRLHTVTSLRIQGVPPEISVELAGLRGRRHFSPTATVNVLRHRLA